jgi:hypothetical protein
MSDEQGMHQQHSSRYKWRCDAYSGAFRTKINPRPMSVRRRARLVTLGVSLQATTRRGMGTAHAGVAFQKFIESQCNKV